MRVAMVSAEYPPMQGGVGDYTRELARALQACDVQVIVITGGRPAPDDMAGPVRVVRAIGGWGWRCWSDLKRTLAAAEADLVHIQYQAAAYGLHPAINLWPRVSEWAPRTLVTFHDLRVPYVFPKAGPLRWRCVLELARRSARAIVTNAEDQARLSPHLPHPPALIPIGANVEPQPPTGFVRSDWREQAGVGEDEVVLAYFGFLSESKGGEELVQALATLRRRGLPVRLWFIGGQVGSADPSNRAYLERVRALIAQGGLESWVRWTGYVSPAEVSANLLAADLCVLPYRDGISFRRGSLMAALAHGLPIVSTYPAVPIPEIADGRNVSLVPACDAEALATRLVALIADPAARRLLSEGARRLAGRFGWASIAARTAELYRALEG